MAEIYLSSIIYEKEDQRAFIHCSKDQFFGRKTIMGWNHTDGCGVGIFFSYSFIKNADKVLITKIKGIR